MQIKQFCSDTWHIAKDTYKTWFTYCWAIIGVRIILGYFYPEYNILSTPFLVAGYWHDGITIINFTFRWSIVTLLVVLTYYTLYASAKPTVQPKNYAYFSNFTFIPHRFALFVWFGIVTLLYWSGNILNIVHIPNSIAIVIGSIVGAIIGLFSLFFLTALFESEQINIGKVCVRAYKVIVKNIPLIIGVGVIFIIAYISGFYVFKMVSTQLVFQHYNPYIHQINTNAASLNDDYLMKLVSDLYSRIVNSLKFAHKYLHACFDFLLALPFLIITATSIYYKKNS